MRQQGTNTGSINYHHCCGNLGLHPTGDPRRDLVEHLQIVPTGGKEAKISAQSPLLPQVGVTLES